MGLGAFIHPPAGIGLIPTSKLTTQEMHLWQPRSDSIKVRSSHITHQIGFYVAMSIPLMMSKDHVVCWSFPGIWERWGRGITGSTSWKCLVVGIGLRTRKATWMCHLVVMVVALVSIDVLQLIHMMMLHRRTRKGFGFDSRHFPNSYKTHWGWMGGVPHAGQKLCLCRLVEVPSAQILIQELANWLTVSCPPAQLQHGNIDWCRSSCPVAGGQGSIAPATVSRCLLDSARTGTFTNLQPTGSKQPRRYS